MCWETITSIGTMIAAIAAWVTVILAKQAIEETKSAVEATKSATEASLLNNLLDEYAGEKMLNSLTAMRNYYNANKEDVIGGWKKQEHSTETELARRHIHWYYKNAFTLYEGGYLSANALKIIANTNGYSIFCEVVAKISRSIDKGGSLAEHTGWIDQMMKMFNPRVWDE